jgi:cell volume regulation protein A
MDNEALLILAGGGLLAAGVVASAVAARVRLPALLLFLGLGMLVGSDGFGWIGFANYSLAHLVGTVALLLILFEGGLTTGLRALRPVLGPSVSLAAIGTAMTAVIAGLCASWLFHFSIAEGLLLGAILSPTDGAAVFALLRGVRLPQPLALTLEGEAGLNDPVAVMLVLVMVDVIHIPGYGPLDAVWFLVKQLVVGAAIGLLMGAIATAALKRLQTAPSGLSLVASFATAAIAYGAAASIGGSGFLAVYLAGLAVGDADVSSRSALLPFVARPVSAFAATARTRFTRRERLLLGWAGLRGGVPVVLATLPLIEHVPRSLEFFNLVFFAVLVSTLIQGATVEALANRLGMNTA